MATPGLAVAITVKGRVGPRLASAMRALDVEVVPRHNAVLVASGEIEDLLVVLDRLDRRGIQLDRIVEQGHGT